MKIFTLGILLCLHLATQVAFSKTYYVSTTGKPNNDGNSFTTALNFEKAITLVVPGDNIILQGGTYIIPFVTGKKNTIGFATSGTVEKPIRVTVFNNLHAIFDFSYPKQEWIQDGVGFSITGSYWYFNGLSITRAGYQGVYVKGAYNTFENCSFYDNRNTGLEINKGGSNTTVINCDSYHNYDPKKGGSMADGFGPKETQGPGNKFIGCRAWENSDDGYDCYNSAEKVIFQNCWAFRNGVDIWNYGGFSGNGNGFKVGGNFKQANHKLTNCIAFGQPQKGFDQNNNTGGLTIYNCTSYSNGTNFGLINGLNSGQSHDLKNDISLYGAVAISNAIVSHNSWSTGFSVSANDFESLDLSLANAVRNTDGTLPNTKLFRLKSGSALIDAGVNVGLAFNGKAPDLGAFESSSSSTTARLPEDTIVNLYPTEVQDELRVEIDKTLDDESSISVYSLRGGEIHSTSKIKDGTVIINCQALSPGIYVGVIQRSDGTVRKIKFIKK